MTWRGFSRSFWPAVAAGFGATFAGVAYTATLEVIKTQYFGAKFGSHPENALAAMVFPLGALGAMVAGGSAAYRSVAGWFDPIDG